MGTFSHFRGEVSRYHTSGDPPLHLPQERTGFLMSCMDSLPRNMSVGKYRRLSRHSGHSAMIHEEGMVSTGAGIDSPHPLQKMQKSHFRAEGRLNMKMIIGE